MVLLASHFVIEDIRISLKEKDMEESQKVFEKFYQRYFNDIELKKIYNEFIMLNLKVGKLKPKPKNLTQILESLEKLRNSRKVITSGGSDLWFKDVRP